MADPKTEKIFQLDVKPKEQFGIGQPSIEVTYPPGGKIKFTFSPADKAKPANGLAMGQVGTQSVEFSTPLKETIIIKTNGQQSLKITQESPDPKTPKIIPPIMVEQTTPMTLKAGMPPDLKRIVDANNATPKELPLRTYMEAVGSAVPTQQAAAATGRPAPAAATPEPPAPMEQRNKIVIEGGKNFELRISGQANGTMPGRTAHYVVLFDKDSKRAAKGNFIDPAGNKVAIPEMRLAGWDGATPPAGNLAMGGPVAFSVSKTLILPPGSTLAPEVKAPDGNALSTMKAPPGVIMHAQSFKPPATISASVAAATPAPNTTPAADAPKDNTPRSSVPVIPTVKDRKLEPSEVKLLNDKLQAIRKEENTVDGKVFREPLDMKTLQEALAKKDPMLSEVKDAMAKDLGQLERLWKNTKPGFLRDPKSTPTDPVVRKRAGGETGYNDEKFGKPIYSEAEGRPPGGIYNRLKTEVGGELERMDLKGKGASINTPQEDKPAYMAALDKEKAGMQAAEYKLAGVEAPVLQALANTMKGNGNLPGSDTAPRGSGLIDQHNAWYFSLTGL